MTRKIRASNAQEIKQVEKQLKEELNIAKEEKAKISKARAEFNHQVIAIENLLWPVLPSVDEFLKLDTTNIIVVDNEIYPIDEKTKQMSPSTSNKNDYVKKHPDLAAFKALIDDVLKKQKKRLAAFYIDTYIKETGKEIEVDGEIFEREKAIEFLVNLSVKLEFLAYLNPEKAFEAVIANEYADDTTPYLKQ